VSWQLCGYRLTLDGPFGTWSLMVRVRIRSSIAGISETVAAQQSEAGIAGNERLTAATGAVLLAMLAVEGITVLSLDQLFPIHIAVGLALIPVVLLKLGSTAYRMVRYYVGTEPYRSRGAPELWLRLMGPVLGVSAVAVLASGVSLIAFGRGGALGGIHNVSAVIFGVAVGIHTLAHLKSLPQLLRGDRPRRSPVPGAGRRWIAVAISLLTGAALASAVIAADPAATTHHHHHHDGGEARNG
jgi:hypothetical protein